ncbi:MAG: polysaccharide pyruvyl transferase family protein [Acidimicrobiaceae bacterium]|nr:polysaccharide pyruvyl transferase family protein [Acidimicrobiaceae bacterium]
MTPRIAVAGWYGSDNLGDELILRSLADAISVRGGEPAAISIDPLATGREHGIAAISHRHPLQSLSLRNALTGCDAMVAAGGLVQSETSPWNIPFHMSRLLAAPSGLPAAALGLGVGDVAGPTARRLARAALRRLERIVVRDSESARRLHQWGIAPGTVIEGADPVMDLEPAPVAAGDTMCVTLRPPNRRGLGTAAHKAARAAPSAATLEAMARAVAAASDAAGLPVRFVTFQASRDSELHSALADQLGGGEVVTPSAGEVLSEVGRSRVVVTMRYHAAIAALLHGRPAVLLDSSPKMAALAAEAGGWAPLLHPRDLVNSADDRRPCSLAAAVTDALARQERSGQACHLLKQRLSANHAALDELIANAA